MKCVVLCLSLITAAFAQQPKVADCFKVHSMIRADEEHYWATWTNACPYTIDSVYVLVRFADHASRMLADGVWSLHFVEPGTHRTVRFNAPGKLTDFAAVLQRKITADIAEAFPRPEPAAVRPTEDAAVQVRRARVVQALLWGAVAPDSDVWRAVALTSKSPEVVVPETNPDGTKRGSIIGDPGEGSYRSATQEPVPAIKSAAAALDWKSIVQ